MLKDYSQPLEYHFSQSSTQFVKFVGAYLHSVGFNPRTICDAYAGCGVVGLELRAYLNTKVKVDFIELQKDVFEKHLTVNSKWKENLGQCYFLSLSQFNQEVERTYDLIIANPPYYEPTKIRLSPNRVKAIAHCFCEGSIEDFFLLTEKSLSTDGHSFFLFPLEFYELQLKALADKYALHLSYREKINKEVCLFSLRHLHKN